MRWLLSLPAIAVFFSFAYAGLFNHDEALGLACALAARELFTQCHEEDYSCFCQDSLYVYSVENCIGREAKYNSTVMGVAYDKFSYSFCEAHGVQVNTTNIWSSANQAENPEVSPKSFALAYEGERNNMSQRAISAWVGVGMILYWAFVVSIVTAREWFRLFILRLAPYRVVMKRPSRVESWIQKHVFLPALFGMRHMRRYEFLRGWVVFTTPTRFESIVVCGYIVLVLIFMLTPYTFMNDDPLYPTRWKEMMRYSSDRAGIIATVQFPLLILFALRNNVFIWFTGWSYSTFNTYHRAVARITYLLLVIHAILKHIFSASYGGSLAKYYYPVPYFRWGCASIGLFSLMIVSAVFRARGYEVFYRLHQAMAIGGLITAHYHLNGLGFKIPLWISFALWGADWTTRVLRILLFNVNVILPPLPGARSSTFATMRLYDGQLVRVSIITPVRWMFSAGQYVYLHTNQYSFIGGHPFSVLGSNEYGDGLELVIKGRTGMTRRLCAQLAERGCSPDYPITMPVYVEGPYGVSAPVERYEEGLFFAGGIGITGVLGYMEKMVTTNKAGAIPKNVSLFWAIRMRSDVQPVMHVLAKLAKMEGVKLHIFLRQRQTLPLPVGSPGTETKGELQVETIGESEFSSLGLSDPETLGNNYLAALTTTEVTDGDEAPLRLSWVPPLSQRLSCAQRLSRLSRPVAASELSEKPATEGIVEEELREPEVSGPEVKFDQTTTDMGNHRISFMRRKSMTAGSTARRSLMPHARTKSEIRNLRRSVIDFVKARNPDQENDDDFDYGRGEFREDDDNKPNRQAQESGNAPPRNQHPSRMQNRHDAEAARHEREQFIDAGFTDSLSRRRISLVDPFADSAYPMRKLPVGLLTAASDREIEAEIISQIKPIGMDIVSIIHDRFLSADGSVCVVGCGPDRMVDTLGWAVGKFLELAEYGRVDYFEEAFRW